MQGSGRVPQWLTGQVSRLDPWCVLSAPIDQLTCSQHSAKRISAVAAPYRGLGEVQEFRSLIPDYGVEVGQDLVQ